MRRRPTSVLLLACVVAAAACTNDGPERDAAASPNTTAAATTLAPPTSVPTTTAPTTPATIVDPAPAGWTVRAGATQLAVLDAGPGQQIELVDDGDRVVADATVDARGSLLFRGLDPGAYTTRSSDAASSPATVTALGVPPPQSFYDAQEIGPGYGYLEVRDGTTLSVNVILPGPVADGPYPTVVEYSGYDPSNPDAGVSLKDLFPALGYAYVGVNIRGSGCSGGAFGFFEPIQRDDGYDVIEAIAAQPWVREHTVGMVGVSYSGISQLYVASTQPPSLAAITPLSPVDDAGRYTLYPGGILNDGFALDWSRQRDEDNAPFGQDWTRERADAGDATCEANQGLRLQNLPLEELVIDNPYYTPAIGDPIAPRLLVGDIEVPVLLAGSWQDEQTGPHFATMLDEFTGTDHFFATLSNGLHTESLTPGVFARYVEFLDLYVAERVPTLDVARGAAPVLAEGLFGTDDVALPPDRFAGMTLQAARAAFESDARVQVLFEQGAADGTAPRTPMPRFVEGFDAWPPPAARATAWHLGAGGVLAAEPPRAPGASSTSYTADPGNVPETYFDDSSGSVWSVDVTYEWIAEPAGTAATFVSEPFAEDTIVIGPGSADLWIGADADDTDVEVTVAEVRADGQEMLVQSGWLRASHRAEDAAASTELQPVHSHAEADAAALPAGELVPIRVEIFPFAHPFRAGSRLKVTVDAPGGNRQIWRFDTVSDGETVTIGHDRQHPSRVVLATLTGLDVPDALPECGALRGQPCRTR